jgi:hypothetical protein
VLHATPAAKESPKRHMIPKPAAMNMGFKGNSLNWMLQRIDVQHTVSAPRLARNSLWKRYSLFVGMEPNPERGLAVDGPASKRATDGRTDFACRRKDATLTIPVHHRNAGRVAIGRRHALLFTCVDVPSQHGTSKDARLHRITLFLPRRERLARLGKPPDFSISAPCCRFAKLACSRSRHWR